MHPIVEALLVGAGDRRRWWRQSWGPAARHAAAWAGALALAVSVASFAPEAAFVWALAAGGCPPGSVHVPLDGGGDTVCVPARMAGRTCADIIVPPAFAALSVGASACFVRALSIGRRHGY